MQQAELIERIKELKLKRNAVILAHYYPVLRFRILQILSETLLV